MGCKQARVGPDHSVDTDELSKSVKAETSSVAVHRESLIASSKSKSASNDVKENQSVDLISNVSDIPEVSSISISSSEPDQLSSVYPPSVSTSSIFERQTSRMTSQNQQESTEDNLWSSSDDSYSRQDSFVSSTSSENRTKSIRALVIQSRKYSVQSKTFINEVYSGMKDF